MENTIEKMSQLEIKVLESDTEVAHTEVAHTEVAEPEIEPPTPEASRKRKRGGNTEIALQFKKIELMKSIIEVSCLNITCISKITNILCLILITLEPRCHDADKKNLKLHLCRQ